MNLNEALEILHEIDFASEVFEGILSDEDVKAIETAIDTVEDVQPVKHGKWILTGDEQLDNIYFGNKCSECEFIYCGDLFNYCPECGAKMDKE